MGFEKNNCKISKKNDLKWHELIGKINFIFVLCYKRESMVMQEKEAHRDKMGQEGNL